MLRSVGSKVAWVGRTASMVFGLALVLALVFGVATMAFAANGNNFVLGVLNNSASAITKLTGNVSGGPALQVQNANTAAGSKALQLGVAAGKAPLTVNATAGKATNLNSDKLDGLEPSQIGHEVFAVVNADGTIRRGRGVSSFTSRRLGAGHYLVSFNRDVRECAYVATTTDFFATQTGVVQSFHINDVEVFTVDSAGTRVDLPFHLIVAC